MKKIKKKLLIFIATFLLSLTSCSGGLSPLAEKADLEVKLGDNVIYGDSFSLSSVYERCARQASLVDDEMKKMIYFSVKPTCSDEFFKVNEVLGYLNPIELNREIVQACDAENLIIKSDIVIDENTKAEDLINFETTYYYILEKEKALEIESLLENFCLIEEFSVPCDEYEEGDSVSESFVNVNERSVLGKSYINGKIYYKIGKYEIPAYGISVRRGLLFGCQTAENGKFDLGYSRNIYGPCWIWADYKNDACTLSNILNINTSTLLKVALPSKLSNLKVEVTSSYAAGKMAACNEILSRFNNEHLRGNKIKKAKIWTKKDGTVSSAPCFNYLVNSDFPDIYLSGVADYLTSPSNLRILHHEYTHYVHCLGTGNKDNFYDDVIFSEIGSHIASVSAKIINNLFETSLKTVPYDFTNKHVLFTENLAEWYSLVGFEKGPYVSYDTNNKKQNGSSVVESSRFDCQKVFSSLVSSKVLSAEDIMLLVLTEKITDFQNFYDALCRNYPECVENVKNCFERYYVSHTNELIY